MSYIVQHIRSTEEGRRPQASQLAEGQFALNVNDASPGVFLKTTEDKVVKVGGVSVGSEAPLAVFNNEYSVGELWYNTNTGDLNVYDGSVWKTTSSQTLSTASATLQDRITLLESDRATASAVTIGDSTTLTAAKEYVDDFFTTFNAQLAGKLDVSSALSNIADGAQGVEVTGRVAAEGLDLSVGGQITAAGCSVDFQSATISFSGATISGLSGEIRDNVDLHLNQSTATDAQILSWDASANSGNGDYAWVDVLSALGVASYVDQAAALLGGLIEGDVYYNTTDSKLTSVTA